MKSNMLLEKRYLPDAESINRELLAGFMRHHEDDDVRRTHLFNARYENIYLTEKQIPQLAAVLDQAKRYAREICGVEQIRAGGWFNYMPPGAVTTAHSHDDDDELLSAVYYVFVPEHSGHLIIHKADGNITIHPEAGLFVFFPPNVVHEVSVNNSNEPRLSIGINFGPEWR